MYGQESAAPRFWTDVAWLLLLAASVYAQPTPCRNKDAIYLPLQGLCLVTTKNAKNWIQAQTSCERNKGNLYRLENDGRLSGPDDLARCLQAASTAGAILSEDFWVDVVSRWSRHWLWVNGTFLNPIQWTTGDTSAFTTGPSNIPVCSRHLSVEYCVFVCYNDGTAYSVLHWTSQAQVCCMCSTRLALNKVNVSTSPSFVPDPLSYSVTASHQGQMTGNLVQLTSPSEAHSETETLCATLTTESAPKRQLLSKSCFAESAFLCRLRSNSSTHCSSSSSNKKIPQCHSEHRCHFLLRDEVCVERDSRPMTWLGARSVCRAAGGDLWTPEQVDDLILVSLNLKSKTSYWVGATSHKWTFDAGSVVFGGNDPDYGVFRCGHVFKEESGVTALARRWTWSDTRCDQQKSYVCQYEQTKYTSANTDQAVICPWPLPPPVNPPISGLYTTTSAGGGGSTSRDNGGPDGGGGGASSASSYVIIPIIAACIAALIILLCAIFMLGFSRRRKWLAMKWQQTRDYFWPFWASTPTYLASDPGFDSLSAAHTGVHSDSGSIFLFPDPAHPDGATHKAHGHAQKAGSKEGSKRNESFNMTTRPTKLQSRSSINSKDGGARRAETSTSSRGGGLVVPDMSRGSNGNGGAHTHGESFAEEHTMSSSYTTSSPHPRQYTTLSAFMNIHEDAESPNNSLRGKPEVALVTNDVDLNFTVNHAYARSQHGSAYGSEVSSHRGIHDLDIPTESTLEIPTRTPTDMLETSIHF